MPTPTWNRALVVVSLAVVMLSLGEAFADSKESGRRGRGANRGTYGVLRAEIARRQQLAAAAERALEAAVQDGIIAQAELDRLRNEVSAAMEEARAAKEVSRSEGDNVNDIKADVISALPADSPYRLAEAAYLKAVDEYQRARDRVLDSDAYRRRYEIVRRGPDSNERLAALRRDSLNADPDVVRTRDKYYAAKSRLGKELNAVLTADAAWQNAVQVSRQARADEAEVKIDVRNALIHKLGATSTRNEAHKRALAAQLALDQARYEINRLRQALPQSQRNRRPATEESQSRGKR